MKRKKDTQFSDDSLVESGTKDVALPSLSSVFFPLVRKVYPNLIAQDLVGVQPLSAPSGQIFHPRYHSGGFCDNRISDMLYPTGKKSDLDDKIHLEYMAKQIADAAKIIYENEIKTKVANHAMLTQEQSDQLNNL